MPTATTTARTYLFTFVALATAMHTRRVNANDPLPLQPWERFPTLRLIPLTHSCAEKIIYNNSEATVVHFKGIPCLTALSSLFFPAIQCADIISIKMQCFVFSSTFHAYNCCSLRATGYND